MKALRTAGLGEEGLKFTDKAPEEEREMAFFRLKSMPIPCCPEEVAMKLKEGITGVPEAEREKEQTEPLEQLAVPAVMVEVVSFKKTISGLENATVTV